MLVANGVDPPDFMDREAAPRGTPHSARRSMSRVRRALHAAEAPAAPAGVRQGSAARSAGPTSR